MQVEPQLKDIKNYKLNTLKIILHLQNLKNAQVCNKKRLKTESVLQSAALRMSLVVTPAIAAAEEEAPRTE